MDEIVTITQLFKDLKEFTKEEIEEIINYAEIEIVNHENDIKNLKIKIKTLNMFKNQKENNDG